MVTIRQIKPGSMAEMPGLCELLIDTVASNASVGFLGPCAPATAESYWRKILDQVGPNLCLWVAEDSGQIVGSVQLSLCERENGQHRAEVQKLFVLQERRGQKISSQLLATLETHAKKMGRWLLVLDTEAGSQAEYIYQHLGWSKTGEIPYFALNPARKITATAIYFKTLAHADELASVVRG